MKNRIEISVNNIKKQKADIERQNTKKEVGHKATQWNVSDFEVLSKKSQVLKKEEPVSMINIDSTNIIKPAEEMLNVSPEKKKVSKNLEQSKTTAFNDSLKPKNIEVNKVKHKTHGSNMNLSKVCQ